MVQLIVIVIIIIMLQDNIGVMAQQGDSARYDITKPNDGLKVMRKIIRFTGKFANNYYVGSNEIGH